MSADAPVSTSALVIVDPWPSLQAANTHSFPPDVPLHGLQPLRLSSDRSDCAERHDAQCLVNVAEAMLAHVVAMPLLTDDAAMGTPKAAPLTRLKCRFRFNGKMTGPTQIFCLRTPRTSRGGPAPTAEHASRFMLLSRET